MSSNPADQDPELLRRLLRAKDRMDAASHEDWSVRRLARVIGVSEAHFAILPAVCRQVAASQGEAGDMKKSQSTKDKSASELIDARVEELGDWRKYLGSE